MRLDSSIRQQERNQSKEMRAEVPSGGRDRVRGGHEEVKTGGIPRASRVDL